MLELIPPGALIDGAPDLDPDGRIRIPIRLVDLDAGVSPAVAQAAMPPVTPSVLMKERRPTVLFVPMVS